MSSTGNPALLVEVTRGAFVESRHRGVIAVMTPEGKSVAQLGGIETTTHFRSAAKPFQALPLVTTGAADYFALTPQELAVINGSHSGEPSHVETVQSILKKIGLTEAALQCGAHLPFDDATTKQLRATGTAPSVLHNNCSGKHSGMLALAQFLNYPLENYLDPEHPIQRLIRQTLARFANVPADEIGVAIDGCSAPVFITTIAAMARSYAQLVGVQFSPLAMDDQLAQSAARIVKAFIEYPVMVGGTRNRLDTDLMQAAPGQLISKVGAEGVQLLGVLPCERYPHGLGIAIKVEDGDIKRARDPIVLETLRQLGVLNETQFTQLARYARATLYNYRKLEVGEVRTCFQLEAAS
jgi:L-asparaginase II